MTVNIAEELLTDVPDWFLIGGWDLTPVGWFRRAKPGVPYRFLELARDLSDRLMVIVTGKEERDGKRWVHVSFSRPSRVPSYDDTCWVKRAFVGPDRMAVQVFPRAIEHVNIAQYCLHLWHCVDGDPTPDFRTEGQI